MKMISVDPAVNEVWAARWKSGKLDRMEHFKFGDDYNMVAEQLMFWSCDVVVVEEPQVYQGANNTKGADAEDLIQLAVTVGAVLAGATKGSKRYKPNEWKGQVPKPIMAARIQKRLSVQELAIAEVFLRRIPKHLHHNAWDAIGIGLYYLHRL